MNLLKNYTVIVLIIPLIASFNTILLISSDLPEVIGMSDRILVLHDGRIAGSLPAGATEPEVMALATGHTGKTAA